jgi:hypothetical protein
MKNPPLPLLGEGVKGIGWNMIINQKRPIPRKRLSGLDAAPEI